MGQKASYNSGNVSASSNSEICTSNSEEISALKAELEETKQVLEIYKRTLFYAHQQLAEGDIQNKNENKHLKNDRSTMPISINPSVYLPKEMWALVFEKYLTNWKDRKSCYDTCRVFRDQLWDSKNGWMFEAVIPALSAYLNKQDYLKCRLVCRKWKFMIDSICPPQTKITFPDSTEERKLLFTRLEQMKAHLSNPFIGGNVFVLQKHDYLRTNFRDPYYMNLQKTVMQVFLQDFYWFLDRFSEHIVSLRLLILIHYRFSQADFIPFITRALSQCKKIQNFNISIWTMLGLPDTISDEELEALIPDDLSVSPTLKFLAINGIWEFDKAQNRILKRCSGQLKRVRMDHWDLEDFKLGWDSLEELDLTQLSFFDEVPNLYQMVAGIRAPALTSLKLLLRDNANLLDLMSIIRNLPQLKTICLHCESGFNGFSPSQILQIPNELRAEKALKEMEIRISYNQSGGSIEHLIFLFLTCFLFLQNLKLTINLSSSFEKVGLNVIEKSYEYKSVVELSPEWLQPERIYMSNIWKWLPFLETLTVSCKVNKKDYDNISYTRKGYSAQLKANKTR